MIKQFTCLIILFCLFPPWTFAFDHKFTHKSLTKEAVKNTKDFRNTLITELGIREGFEKELNNGKDTYTLTKWLQEGSKEEDEPACRAANHFHNPLKSWEQAQLTDTSFWVDVWCDITSPYRIKHSDLVWATGFIDKDQTPLATPVNNILDPDNGKNGRNWSVARDQFYFSLIEQDPQQREAFFAETFRTLGYVLHLLQDMAVPAHTRNDFSEGHFQNIGCPEQEDCVAMDTKGNPFEGYVRNHFEDEIKPLIVSDISKPFIGEKILTNFWDTDTHVLDTTPANFTGQNLGLAEYTNVNFVSYGTIFKDESDTEHYFQYPNRESITAEDYPDQIDQRIYDILSRDNKLDKGVYITKNKNGEQIDKFLKPRYIPYVYGADWDTEFEKRYDLKFTLDDQCYRKYATHLIPRAIGYSAALLDYFFRGKLEVKFNNGGITIFNRSEETMEDGFFEVFYDTPNGVRTLLLKEDVNVNGLASGDSQTIYFSIPDCVQLTVVYRGKLGDEQDAVIGKVIEGASDCVVIKAGDSSGTHLYTIWSPITNTVAEISDPVTGTPISFPVEYDEISNWLSQHSATVTTPAYQWEMENNALKRIGESWMDADNCSCTVNTDIETSCNDYQEIAAFSHPGCGEFTAYCDYSQTLTTQDGKDVWDTLSEGTVFVDKSFWESILGSYAPVVNTSIGNGEAACMRSQWYQRQSVHSFIPDGSLAPLNNWTINQPITWITPIGEMDLPSQSYEGTNDYFSVYNCPSTSTWSRWHRDPPYDGDPIAKPVIYANYSDEVMVQLYFVSTVQWSGMETEEEVIVNGKRECQVGSYEESYATDNKLTASCTLYNDGATAHDPRVQKRNPEFENAILSLVEHTIAAQQTNGEISEEELFQGGINIYIAGNDNDGPETGLLKLVNEERALLGLYPFLPDNNLNSAAQRHAADMAANKSLSHTGSDGSTVQDRFNATGYTNIVKPGGSSSGTEYIASGYETAADFFTSFRISSSWNSIMNSEYREMGVSSRVDDEGKRYWCVTFGFNDEH